MNYYLEEFLSRLSDLVWGPPLLILLVGTHVFLTFRLRGIQRYLLRGIRLSFSRTREREGDISHFGALMTAVAAFGIGNMVQANSISALASETFHIRPWLTGAVLTALTAFVILGASARSPGCAGRWFPSWPWCTSWAASSCS